jgi:hypothetical protein
VITCKVRQAKSQNLKQWIKVKSWGRYWLFWNLEKKKEGRNLLFFLVWFGFGLGGGGGRSRLHFLIFFEGLGKLVHHLQPSKIPKRWGLPTLQSFQKKTCTHPQPSYQKKKKKKNKNKKEDSCTPPPPMVFPLRARIWCKN